MTKTVAEIADFPDETDLFRIIRRAGRSDREKAKAVAAVLEAFAAHLKEPAP